jgi:hypothetical protein
MRQLDLTKYVVNQDYSAWPIDFAMSASFEMPSSVLQSVLPAGLYVMEPRPGLGLLNTAVFHFPADTYGLTAECSEVVLSVHVMPNVSTALALPRMAMFTLRLGASSREFLDSAFATDHYPIYPEPLDVRIDRERIAVEVFDQRGSSVLQLAAATDVSPPYERDRFYVQSFTQAADGFYSGGNLFDFERAENQRNLLHAGNPIPHPFYFPLDLTGVTSEQCLVQMWSRPGSIGCENHFFLKRKSKTDSADDSFK